MLKWWPQRDQHLKTFIDIFFTWIKHFFSTCRFSLHKVKLFSTCGKLMKLQSSMDRMLALLPDDYKPDLIVHGLFLCYCPIEVWSHLLQEKISDPCALALKADKLFQSWVSSLVNLLTERLEDVQVNAVSIRTRPAPPAKRSSTSAPPSSFPFSPGPCWYHKKHWYKAQNCRKPCLE